MLGFEKWINEQSISESAKKMFAESVMCYKVGAFRSAFIVSYVGFYIVIRDRILERANSKPNDIEQSKWDNYINNLKSEETWEKNMFDYTQNNSSNSIFKLSDGIRNDLASWRNKRNNTVHGNNENVSNAQVEFFWEFIKRNLHRFYVGGGVEYLTSLVCNSLDIRLKSEGYNYTQVAEQMNESMTEEEIILFLEEVNDYYEKLYSHKIEVNYDCFFKSLAESRRENLRKSLIGFIKKEEKYNNNQKFLYFYNRFPMLFKELLEDEEYTKRIWNKNVEYMYDRDLFDIFAIYDKEKLLVPKEYEIFFEKIFGYITLIYSAEKDERLNLILVERGLYDFLAERIKSLNLKDFRTANSYETHFHYVIKYCTIDKELYDLTLYYLQTRKQGTSLYDGIDNILENELKARSRFLKYESENNDHQISQRYGLANN